MYFVSFVVGKVKAVVPEIHLTGSSPSLLVFGSGSLGTCRKRLPDSNHRGSETQSLTGEFITVSLSLCG